MRRAIILSITLLSSIFVNKILHATDLDLATFAGGCFWCMEADFDKLEGVYSTTSVYTGGTPDEVPYEEASDGIHGHAEAVVVLFDPAVISYEKLLDYYWRHIDPTVQDKQFCDEGPQYRTIIFYHTPDQQALAEASKKKWQRKFTTVYTEIRPLTKLYKAQVRHQDYHQRNPWRYRYYRYRCGRDQRLQEIWGNPK